MPNGRGARVQTILTRPAGAVDRLPAVMLVQWLSCDGIEWQPPLDGMNELSKRIATQSGMVMLRVEKPGLGKSEGPPCGDTDFETELAGYRAGLEMLRAHPWVDAKRIVLVGMSNGGGILPLVAEKTPIAGYVVLNGWSKTWFEHMLEFMRRDLEYRGTAAGDVASRMRGFEEFYAGYLLDRKLPGDVVKAKPHLASLWNDEPARQYGRPAAFYHQLQSLNLAEAWSKVSVPTLVVWGEYDWIMSRDDHERIVALVNANTKGAARLMVVPGMTHFVSVHDTLKDAMAGKGGKFPEEVASEVLRWLRGTS